MCNVSLSAISWEKSRAPIVRDLKCKGEQAKKEESHHDKLYQHCLLYFDHLNSFVLKLEPKKGFIVETLK